MSQGERATLEQRMVDVEDQCESLAMKLALLGGQVRELEREQERSERNSEGSIWGLLEQVRDLRRDLEQVGQ